jgi:hypothetical protein
MSLVSSLRAAAAAPALLGLALAAPGQQPAQDGWRPFKATWTLTGQRDVVVTEGERPAAIVHLKGPLTLTSGEGLGRGFLGEVIGFDDGGTLLAGRAVFTDQRGDRIYCRLQAEPIGNGRHATATITGGTGRFAGIEGSFSFAWQYVVDQDGGETSLRTVNIEGRTRRGPAARSQGSP